MPKCIDIKPFYKYNTNENTLEVYILKNDKWQRILFKRSL